jgi:hypothetical protein
MEGEDLNARFDAVLQTCLDYLDWLVVSADAQGRQRALELKQQILQLREKLDARVREGRAFNAAETEILERALPAWVASLPEIRE